MSIIKSLLFGTPGTYNLGGIKVTFQDEDPYCSTKLEIPRAFLIVSHQYFYTFIHEMGHALMGKRITNQNQTIEIYKKPSIGAFGRYTSFNMNLAPWQESLILSAGVISTIGVCGIQLYVMLRLLALKFKNKFIPVCLTWYFMSPPSLWQITLQTIYAFLGGKNSDFERIARKRSSHLAAARAAIVSELVLIAIPILLLLRKIFLLDLKSILER